MAGSGRTTAGRVATAAIAVLAVLATVIVVGFFTVFYLVAQRTRPPDVAAVARSAAVAEADVRATALLNDRLATVVGVAPWLTPKATAVLDTCDTDTPVEMFGEYRPVRCTRSVTRYFAFDGKFATLNGDWDRALQAAGWSVTGEEMNSIVHRYRNTPAPGASTSPSPLLATDLPGVGYYGADSVTLGIGWFERPKLPWVHTEFQQGRPPTGSSLAVIRAAQAVDVETVARDAFTAHQYLAVVSMSQTYYDAGLRSPIPTENEPQYRPCYSGSNDCVGG